MSNDGIQSVDQLRIEITADAEKFANGIKATREQLATFVGDSVPMLGKFDAALGAIGNGVAAIPGQIAAAMGAIAPFMATATMLLGYATDVAAKLGLKEDVDKIGAAFTGLFHTIADLGEAVIGTPHIAGSAIKQSFAAAEAEAKALAVMSTDSTVTAIAKDLITTIHEMDAIVAVSFRETTDLTTQQLLTRSKMLSEALKEMEEKGGESFRSMNYFTGMSEGMFAPRTAAQIDETRAALKGVNDELAKRPLDVADISKTIDNLKQQNAQLDIQLATLGMSAAEATRVAVQWKLAQETAAGKTISPDQTKEFDAQIDAMVRAKQALEEFNVAKKQAEDDRKRAETQQKGLENLDQSMNDEIDAIRSKTREVLTGNVAGSEALFIERELNKARKANLDMSGEDIAKVIDKAKAWREANEIYESAVSSQKLADNQNRGVDALNTGMETELEGMRSKIRLIEMGTAAAAYETFVQKELAKARQQNLDLNDADIAGIRAAGREAASLAAQQEWLQRSKKNAEHQDTAVVRLNDGMDAEIESINAKTRAMQYGTSMAAEEVFFQKEMNAARRANIEMTDQDIAGIRATARAYGEANEALRVLQSQLRLTQEIGGAMSSAIDSQFVAWTNGAAFNVKKMEQQILASLANIALKTLVLGPLFGGSGTEGGGLMGGLMGGVLSGLTGGLLGGGGGKGGGGLFGGFFAEGGAVAGDVPIVVGERGPELFVPQGAGAVVPNHALGGGGAPTVNLHIDARGATPDAVAMLRAQIPSMVIQTMTEHQSRTGN